MRIGIECPGISFIDERLTGKVRYTDVSHIPQKSHGRFEGLESIHAAAIDSNHDPRVVITVAQHAMMEMPINLKPSFKLTIINYHPIS